MAWDVRSTAAAADEGAFVGGVLAIPSLESFFGEAFSAGGPAGDWWSLLLLLLLLLLPSRATVSVAMSGLSDSSIVEELA